MSPDWSVSGNNLTLVPSDILSLLPIILQLIIPLIQANNNNNNNYKPPPPTTPPAPHTQPPNFHTDPPQHYHHHHLSQPLFPSSSLFSFPFDYSGFYNNLLPFYDYSVFYDPFLPFRTNNVSASATGGGKNRNTNKRPTLRNRKTRKQKKLKLFRAYKVFPSKGGTQSEKNAKPIRKRKRKIPSGKKRRKPESRQRRPIAFKRRLKVPGAGRSVTVSSQDLMRGIKIRYRGKSYKLSLSQFFSYFKRKKSQK